MVEILAQLSASIVTDLHHSLRPCSSPPLPTESLHSDLKNIELLYELNVISVFNLQQESMNVFLIF